MTGSTNSKREGRVADARRTDRVLRKTCGQRYPIISIEDGLAEDDCPAGSC